MYRKWKNSHNNSNNNINNNIHNNDVNFYGK